MNQDSNAMHSKQLIKFIPSTLLPSLISKSFQYGDVIYQTGDQPQYIYFILSGRVRLYIGRLVNKRKYQETPRKSVVMTNTYFGDNEVLQDKRRAHTAVVQSHTVSLLLIPKQHATQLHFFRIPTSTIFQDLSPLSYDLLPKLLHPIQMVKDQAFLTSSYPIGIILSGQLTVKRQITFTKEDFCNHLYEFKKVLPVLTFTAGQTVLWDCWCVSAHAEVMAMGCEEFEQMRVIDERLRGNVEGMRDVFRRGVGDREQLIRRTMQSKDIEQALGLSVHFKTEPDTTEISDSVPIHPNIRYSDKTRLIKLRQEIIKKTKQPRLPKIMQNVLFKMPLKRSDLCTVRKKLQQCQQKHSTRPQITFLSNQMHRLFHTPDSKTKFSMKFLQQTNRTHRGAGFYHRQAHCKKRRSLILIPN